MQWPRWITLLGLCWGCAGLAWGIFTPDEVSAERPYPFKISVSPDQSLRVEPLPHSYFKTLLNESTELQTPSTPEFTQQMREGVPTKVLTAKGLALQRIEARQARIRELTADDLTGLTADLLRLGRGGEAVGLLAPKLRNRQPDFRLIANLVFAHAQREEWEAAVDRHNFLLLDVDPPRSVKGLSAEQLRWILELHRGPVKSWLAVRRQISQKPTPLQAPGEEAEVYPLFVDAQRNPVRFVNEQNEYVPGQLATHERAKLPKNALASVQQLAIWMPNDAMLLWLLAELYAAEGRIADAADAFDQCTARGLTRPVKLMSHRAIVRAEAQKLTQNSQPEIVAVEEPSAAPEGPQERGIFALVNPTHFAIVVGLFGIVVVILLVLQVQSLRRRRRKR